MTPASGRTNALSKYDGPGPPAVLTVKKILAGRGAVDYYLNQTRRGLADYYLPDDRTDAGDGTARLSAPGSSWWGSGAETLTLNGEVERAEFVPLFTKAVAPGGGYLGSRFRLPEEAAAAKGEALAAASEITDPYERWTARHEIRRRGGHASVAAWDCTFSPPKSVSLLWAAGDRQVQQQVWAAHLAAVDAGLAYLEEHAAYVRAGAQGVRVLDTSGFVVARMNEWTSRDGDMHLHTHCLILNRAETAVDGKWRALDGRALLSARTGAGALYNRILEAELTRRLGVAWRDRPDGLRELDGVDDELIEAFSSRRRAITATVEQLAAAYRDKYGADAPPAVLSAMAQTAWAKTRQRKRDLDPGEALEQWEATARRHGRQLARLPEQVLARAPRPSAPATEDEAVTRLLARLADSGRATFTRHDMLRAALDALPPTDLPRAEVHARAERLVAHALSHPALVGVTPADVVDAPAELRRRDGSSVYEQPERQRWALKATLDQEAWLLDIAAESTGRTTERDVVEASVVDHDLGGDQAGAVRELLGSERRIGLLVGPAGAGKTRTLRAVVAAWQHGGGDVLGLTVSQSAAGVLAAEAHVRAENTAKWLYESRCGNWRLPDGVLVLVDEASMVSTADLVEIVEQARRAGGKVLLVGDPAQLAAIHIGGAFDLLAERHGAARLHEIRRFAEAWEADASLQLRRRDPAALAEYAMRARIHGGTTNRIEAELFDAWRVDALAGGGRGRRSVLMIVSTNEQAAVLAERARHALLEAGAVTDGPTVRLRDNAASVGDHIVTRRNDRRLRTSSRGWVVNGDVWTVIATYPDGAADVRRHADGSTLTLPADYLAAHAHLAYATTAHRAQGMTVDVCHAAVTAETSHEQLYVAATRGRNGNQLWVVVDSDRDVVRDREDLPAPEEILTRVLQRKDPDRLSAHQVIEDTLHEIASLARLGAMFEDAARTATDQWLRDTLTARGLGAAADDPQWRSLVSRARELALAGHDLAALVEEAIHMRTIDDAHSAAAVLHWRLGVLGSTPAPRPRGPLASLPPTDGPEMAVARQAGELMRQRWRDLRATLAATSEPLPWAPALGPRPSDPAGASAWLTAATAVTAYRERYEVPEHAPMLGPRPAGSRPDARAAWDHACLQADRYLAPRLRHLDDLALAELDARQQAILDNPPPFDPTELEQARRRMATPARGEPRRGLLSPAQLLAHRLERAAEAHRDWRRVATDAFAIRRQIALELQRRRRDHRIRPPGVRPAR
jgi:conjugative relaxase-like TrwC/TraI family protein